MKRRELLRNVAAASALTLAGCVSENDAGGGSGNTTDSGDGGSGDGDTATEAGTATDTPTATPTGTSTQTDTVTPTDTTTATPTASPEPTETPAVDNGVDDTGFEVTGTEGGGEVDDASVSFDDGANTVSITGTIWGNDGCQSARLEAVELDSGSLTVRVLEFLPPEDEDKFCTQGLIEIDYEASVTLADGLPDRVNVVHVHGAESTTAASVER